jgi:Glutathione synthase/Ribosomal protein S6 modification enzyme (glutaminyl transferase)
MNAWIIYYRDGADYNRQYINFYIEKGKKLGIDVKLILVEDLEFGVRDSKWLLTYQKNYIANPDFVIFRAIHPLLNKQLETMGIPVFNNSFISEICNDKAKTYQYLAKTGIKMVDSCFYRNNQVRELLDTINAPTIIKAVEGHGGSQVFLWDNSYNQRLNDNRIQKSKEIKEQILKGISNSDVVVQPLIGNKNQDLRVYVIGKEIIAAVLRTAKDGFKSNFSLGGEVTKYELKDEEKKIVHCIIEQFDFGLVGIDFIIGNEGELIFNEIEDVVGSRMLYQCAPEINIVELYLKYILKNIN